MASSKDFVANQIRTAKVIMTGSQPGDGGIGVGNIGLSIYDQSIALNSEGGVSDGNLYAGAGSEVKVFISGSANYKGRDAGNSHVLFGGNLSTSGSMHFMNPALAQASVTITSSGSPNNGQALTLIATDGTSVTLTLTADGTDATGGGGSASNIHFARNGSSTHSLAELKALIEAHPTLSGDFTVSSVTTSGSNKVITILQIGAGSAGNTVITNNLNTYNLGAGAGANSAFSGGIGPTSTFIFSDSERENHLYLSGTFFASGSSDATPYGTISGSIHHTRDGLSYLKAGTNITIASASNGQVTISASGGSDQNLFQTITLDGSGAGTQTGNASVVADSTTDTLTLAAGANITLDGNAGSDTITISSTDTNTNTQLTTEEVQDIVGGMLVGTETRIGVTYDDTNGRIDFVVDDMTADTNTFRTIAVDTSGNGSADETLGSSETLMLKKGTNITLAESGGVVTISSADTDTNTQNTTTLSFVDSSDDIILRNTTGGATSSTDDIKFVAGSNITLTHTDADNITIASSGGSYSFDIDANGGTAQTIANTNTVGFNEGIGTVVSRASKDIHIAASGSAQTLVYSHMGPHYLLSGSYGVTAADTGMNAMKTGVTDAVVSANGTGTWQPGPVSSFLAGSGESPPAIGFKTVIPKGATKIKLTLFCKANQTGGDPARPVQFVWAGRYYEVGEEVNTGNTDATAGHWLGDSEGTTAAREGWRVFPDFTVSNPLQFKIESSIENITAVVNSASAPANGGILDIAIARNRNSGNNAVFGTTSDTYTNTVHVIYVKVEFPIT